MARKGDSITVTSKTNKKYLEWTHCTLSKKFEASLNSNFPRRLR